MKTRRVISILAGISILMASSAGIVACGGTSAKEETLTAVPVKLKPVEEKSIAIPVRTSGRLYAGTEMKMSFKVGGPVENLSADEGDRVSKGQILASLKLTEVRAQVDMARSSLEKAERDFKRAQDLYADEVVTLEQLQNSQTALEMAKSSLEIAQFNLDHSVIKAPADGILLKYLVEENELVSAGTPILLLGATDREWIIKTGVTDRDIVHLIPGDSADIEFDAYPGAQFAGRVTEISESPDQRTGTYEVELSLADTDSKLLSGFSAKVTIHPSKTSTFFMVPIDALVQGDGIRGVVFALDSPETVTQIPVEISHIVDDRVAVAGGLLGISQVVTDGSAYIADGAHVAIQ